MVSISFRGDHARLRSIIGKRLSTCREHNVTVHCPARVFIYKSTIVVYIYSIYRDKYLMGR